MRDEDEDHLSPPWQRDRLTGHEAATEQIEKALAGGQMTGGWMIAAPEGSGKATLSWLIIRALLSGEGTLIRDRETQADHLVKSRAHPDLFAAEPLWDDKKERFDKEIKVETIRKLISFMTRTPSLGNYRAAIIDSADQLNRNAANALLKILEEPPKNTLILLVAHAPGRLLPTIRSRCRKISLGPVPEADVATFLEQEKLAQGDTARDIAAASEGRPGYAARLAGEDGQAALALTREFLDLAARNRTLYPLADKLTAKGAEAVWPGFQLLLLQMIARAARQNLAGKAEDGPLAHADPVALAQSWQEIRALGARGNALNVNRTSLIHAMGSALRPAFAGT